MLITIEKNNSIVTSVRMRKTLPHRKPACSELINSRRRSILIDVDNLRFFLAIRFVSGP